MNYTGRRPDHPPAAQLPEADSESAVFWRNRATGLFDRLPLLLAFCRADGTIMRANPAMAAEWDTLAGALTGRSVLDLFYPESRKQLRSVTEAIRLRRRSRYSVAVRWTTAAGVERQGEVIVDLVSDTPREEPDLLLLVRAEEEGPVPADNGARFREKTDDTETCILALTAGGRTTAQVASAVGLTADGVNYHLKQLSRRWGVSGKAALVARAYAEGVLAPGTWPPAPTRAATPPRADS
ncbi:LuxR C-terminal-related transcriptional regulator [Streptomyces sp. ML-6]|uniref:helix-turn-helix transcriptional regulator n=1 Tax=Streptomyces sp. ML-6 TaxID=2982693 RepID=UPI0024BFE0E5|nr:LuxR C-terminal-related transcriptional regulator [Streptomyces sp. ML-6]MDK0524219.1 LuxR C-terminal-related transcriptional regulator [Streptomyces sp. ML-6]